MAAVHEGQTKQRRKRARTADSRGSVLYFCSSCQKETHWLSVDRMCWDCTIKAAKNKVPLFVDSSDEEAEGGEGGLEILEGW